MTHDDNILQSSGSHTMRSVVGTLLLLASSAAAFAIITPRLAQIRAEFTLNGNDEEMLGEVRKQMAVHRSQRRWLR